MGLLASLLFTVFASSLWTDPASGACPPSFDEVAGNCFLVLPNILLDYLDARTVCRNQGGDLAVVKDCNLLGALSTYLLNYPDDLGDGVWVGATDVLVEGTFRWIDETLVTMGAPFWSRVSSQYFEAEPSGGISKNCAFINTKTGFYFSDGDCEKYTGYAPLCQTAPGVNETCPSQYVLVNGRCLEFLSTIDVTWGDARDVCLATGGNLATINDCNLMAAVINHVVSTGLEPTYGYWIGASDAWQEGNWTWTDGSATAMGVPFWGQNSSGALQPDNAGIQNCMALSSSDRFYFADESCGSPMAPLCQVDPLPTTPPPPTTTVVPPPGRP